MTVRLFWPAYIIAMIVVATAATWLAMQPDALPPSGYATADEVQSAISRLPEDDPCSRIIKTGNLEALRQGAHFERADLNDLSAGIEVCRATLRQKANG